MGLAAGTRFGPYEITGPLGAGGMGEVYSATDTTLGRPAAIKTLPNTLGLAGFEQLQNDFVAHLELPRTRPENRDHGHRSHESRE
jgi:serine/threonine protein kinase